MTSSVSIMADIGGTNTRVALATGARVDDSSIQRFKNADHSGLEDVLSKYLKSRPTVSPSAACAAIAGPVANGRGKLTNLDWDVDNALLKRVTGAETTSVINDLQAQGHALDHLPSAKTRTIEPGMAASATAAKLIVGVGTGFNAAAVFHSDSETIVPPAEAGHGDLPTPNHEMASFAKHFTDQNGFCSVEDMISGRGLGFVYQWLSGSNKSPADIMASHRDGSDLKSSQAVETFCRALGAVCGNLALNILPFGGIYLVGGVSLAVSPFLKDSGFIEAFRAKGRFTEFMAQFPIHVVEDDYAALTGMAAFLDEIQNSSQIQD